MDNKILVLGSDGFLGNSLYLNLLDNGSFDVIGTSRKIQEKEFFDLNQRHEINFSEYDAVIFLAGMTSIQECEKFPELAYKTNYTSTIRTINECVNAGCFVIFLSTNCVFSGKKSFYNVNDHKDPSSIYGKCKDAVEKWVTERHPENVAILRLTKVVPLEGVPLFAQRWVSEIKENGHTDVYTNHFLSPVNEYEVFDALILLLMTKRKGIFQLGGQTELSYADYAKEYFMNDENSLRCLNFIEKGNGINFNSLKTVLPHHNNLA